MKRFGCIDSLLMLPISGAFLALLGIVLTILYIVARGLTASLDYIEGAIPTYVAAVLLISTGAIMIILFKRRPNPLIYLSIVVNCVAFSVSTLQAISVGIVSIPFLHSFSVCVYHNSLSECQCYIISARQNNSTGIIVPGADSEKFTFQAVRSCAVIEHNMIDCLYILCIIYGFAGITSLVTGSLSFMLLCFQRRATKEAHALQVATSSRRGQSFSGTGGRTQTNAAGRLGTDLSRAGTSDSAAAGTATGNNTTTGRRATIGHHDVRNDRPHIVQRSSSTSGTHGRQHLRHTSGGGIVRATSAVQHSSQSQRQSRPPVLVRGGYLQIHVNGPSIPVYIVPGSSNQAFIALTDLPSLQLPSLDTVPAYVSEVTELYPPDQPPPYSPTPDEHPPLISIILESPSTSTPGNGGAPLQRLELNEDSSIVQSDIEHVQSENRSGESVLFDGEVGTVSTESAVSNNVSATEMNITETAGSDQNAVVQAGLVSERQSQTDQSLRQLSTSDSTQQAEAGQEIGSDVQQSPQHSSEIRRNSHERISTAIVSQRTDDLSIESALQTEPSTAQITQPELPQPGHSQIDTAREQQASDSKERYLPTPQSVAQGAKPKHYQGRPPKEGRSTQRKSSPHRRSSSGRSVSPSRRKATSAIEISENTTRQPFHPNREVARARSNSRGRQKQLPDILQRNDCLPDTKIRCSQEQPAKNATNRAKLHQKLQKTVDPIPQLLSNREADHQSPSKNAKSTQRQTSTRPNSKGKQYDVNSKKDSFRKDDNRGSKSTNHTSGSSKIEMTIPSNLNSSSSESLTNIMTLVESVHSSAKMKPKVHRPPVNLEKRKLLDSRV